MYCLVNFHIHGHVQLVAICKGWRGCCRFEAGGTYHELIQDFAVLDFRTSLPRTPAKEHLYHIIFDQDYKMAIITTLNQASQTVQLRDDTV